GQSPNVHLSLMLPCFQNALIALSFIYHLIQYNGPFVAKDMCKFIYLLSRFSLKKSISFKIPIVKAGLSSSFSLCLMNFLDSIAYCLNSSMIRFPFLF